MSQASGDFEDPGVPDLILDQVNIVVSDMERSIAFYRLLGLRDDPTPSEWQPHHRRLVGGASGTADVELDSRSFATRWNAGYRPSTGPGSVVLGFKLSSRDAVDEVYERVVGSGYRSQQHPFDAFWGARYAIVEDPDGNPVGLMSPAEAAMRWPIEPPAEDSTPA